MSKELMSDDEALALAGAVVEQSRKRGADAAEVVLSGHASLGVSYRLSKQEDIDRAESIELGLRVFIDGRQATVASTDCAQASLDEAVDRVIDMARAAPRDAYAGLADAEQLYRGGAALELEDSTQLDAEALIELAAKAEAAALAMPKITNSEGASAGWTRGFMALVTSGGFADIYRGSSFSVSASVIASAGGAMERDYDFSSARHFSDLDAAEKIGRQAGERAARRLGPAKIKTAAMPVVFEPREAMSLLGHFAAAVNGQAVARGTSFLRDHMGEQIFAAGINIIDDATRKRGLASHPFDGEGVAARRLDLVKDGKLLSWFLDCANAKQLGLTTTGSAMRGANGRPQPGASNLYMEKGQQSPQEMFKSIDYGFYVTELIGMGVNPVTGDYSRGASGFLIEKGEITRPVAEVTIAGNLIDMFARATPANDLTFKYAVNTPTLMIDSMMVAGE